MGQGLSDAIAESRQGNGNEKEARAEAARLATIFNMSEQEQAYTQKMLSRRSNVVAYGYHKDGRSGFGRSALERELKLKAKKRNIPLSLVFPPANNAPAEKQQKEAPPEPKDDDAITFVDASGALVTWRPEIVVESRSHHRKKKEKRRRRKKKQGKRR